MINININVIQKKISEIDIKIKSLDLETYMDHNFNYRIKKGSNDIIVKFINSKNDFIEYQKQETMFNDVIYISLNENLKFECLNVVTENDLEDLINIKKKL